MDEFSKILSNLKGVMKAATHPLSFAALLMVLVFMILFNAVPDSLMASLPPWLIPIVILIFVGTAAIAVLRLVFVSVSKDTPVPRSDNAEFREFLATESPELLAKWVIRESAGIQATEATPEQVGQVAEAINALTEIEDAPPQMLTMALEKLEEGSTDAAEKLFEMVSQREGVSDDHRFEALTHLGTLKFLHDTTGAEAAFTEALQIKPDDMNMLNRMAHVHSRKGELVKAEENHKKSLALAQQADDSANQAVALSNLGNLCKTKGELDKAEEFHREALDIDEALGRKDGMANHYGNLGILYQTKGELDKAEEMYLKALAIDEALGRKEGMANQFCNLGVLYGIKGWIDKAEEMYRKSLAIEKALGRKQGIANNYGNLGNLYYFKGDLDKAEEMYLKSLEIDKALDNKVDMASQYGNLGIIYDTKGDQDKAEKMYLKALTINKTLGQKIGMAMQYGNLGVLYESKRDLGKAKEMYHKSLIIDTALGRKEGMANQYVNLGGLHQHEGDMIVAQKYLQKARDLFTEIGIAHEVKKIDTWLAEAEAAEKPQD